MTHASTKFKVVAGLIPADQRRILIMDAQGLRPGQIAHALRLRVGGVSAVCDVLAHHGRPIDLKPQRLAS